MKHRYFICLSFKGTQYHGWQLQPNALTVQQKLDEALSVILQEPIETLGAGRTDTGVHASYFIAHFDSIKNNLAEDQQSIRKINQVLPKDISVYNIFLMPDNAHARFDALSRTYHYIISLKKDPFLIDYVHFMHETPNIELMNKACDILCKTSDFTSFSKLHTDAKTNNCKLFYAHWEQQGSTLIFRIKADRFLRNMVRAIVGTLIDVGKEKTSIPELEQIIESQNRCSAGNSMPPQALFLTNIEYPDNYGLTNELEKVTNKQKFIFNFA